MKPIATFKRIYAQFRYTHTHATDSRTTIQYTTQPHSHRVTEKHTLWLCAATWMFERHVFFALSYTLSVSLRPPVDLALCLCLVALSSCWPCTYTHSFDWIVVHTLYMHTYKQQRLNDSPRTGSLCARMHTQRNVCIVCGGWLTGGISWPEWMAIFCAHYVCPVMVWICSSGSVPDAVETADLPIGQCVRVVDKNGRNPRKGGGPIEKTAAQNGLD